ncbi:MAG TPA: hypothetical protein VNF91_09265 [Candidatus Acidoferrum sp.]|nr:hypothetical protein [Candidatus Acidoferrum sp.]
MSTALFLMLAPLQALAAPAEPPPPPSYRQAVEDAYNLVKAAAPGDATNAPRAVAALEAGTGTTQLEILSDLQRRPPDYEDAKARLLTLLAALDKPADTSDPQVAQRRLHDVLAMHRYDALHRPPSVLDRFGQWVRDRIDQLLRLIFGGGGGTAPGWFFYVVGVAVVAAVAVIVFRSARGRFTEALMANQPDGPRAPADYFAEADRLAARGDRVGAIRNLCAGVAATLAGERTWDGSPLTVREIFQRASDPGRLGPLLLPFEAAVYGGREVDLPTYERAKQVAAPFRQPAEAAA